MSLPPCQQSLQQANFQPHSLALPRRLSRFALRAAFAAWKCYIIFIFNPTAVRRAVRWQSDGWMVGWWSNATMHVRIQQRGQQKGEKQKQRRKNRNHICNNKFNLWNNKQRACDSLDKFENRSACSSQPSALYILYSVGNPYYMVFSSPLWRVTFLIKFLKIFTLKRKKIKNNYMKSYFYSLPRSL